MKNWAFESGVDDYYTQTKDFLVPLVPLGTKQVLDLGCAAGAFGRQLLKHGRAEELYGVEIFEPAALQAREVYRSVAIGDIEEMQLTFPVRFDAIVCGDILEHLRAPEVLLRRISSWLSDNGVLICCLPNVRHWRVIAGLLIKGDWRYKKEGIMDQTHLRFFTLRSISRLLSETGFSVTFSAFKIWQPADKCLGKILFGTADEFLGYQIYISAIKTGADARKPKG